METVAVRRRGIKCGRALLRTAANPRTGSAPTLNDIIESTQLSNPDPTGTIQQAFNAGDRLSVTLSMFRSDGERDRRTGDTMVSEICANQMIISRGP
jgi:hypothetical protein